MNIFQSIFLGIVQGLAEFLPISSKGHLVIMQSLMGIKVDDILAYDVLLHLGTLVAVFTVFFKDIVKLIEAFFGCIADLSKGKGLKVSFATPYRKLLVALAIGTVPVIIATLLFEKRIEAMFESGTRSVLYTGFGLLLTALIIFIAERIPRGNTKVGNLNYKQALVVGLFQMLAVMPGVSRSGSTISGGLFSRLDREFALKFSFLMAVPAVLGACAKKLPDLIKSSLSFNELLVYISGAFAALVFGIIAIVLLNKLVRNKKLYGFVIYCAVVGIACIIYSLFQ